MEFYANYRVSLRGRGGAPQTFPTQQRDLSPRPRVYHRGGSLKLVPSGN